MGMAGPPPNEALAELVSVLSEEDTRDLVRLYLADFPGMMEALARGPEKDHVRLAHSLKSSSQYMGAAGLGRLFADLEHRLGLPGEKVTQADLKAIAEEFERVAGPLRAFVGP
jgi:HPt (histidine-containing phosphotransfer) domain-containing protein